MKCENDDCNNEVPEMYIEHGCAGYLDHDDCTRHCSCCLDCRDKYIDGSLEDEE